METIDYKALKRLQGKLHQGSYHGIGIGCYVEATGSGPPYEGAKVVVTGPDQVAVYLGVATLGQGHETTMAQICADGLGVPIEYVTVYHGDTDLMPFGGGTFSSRVTVMAGNAVYMASQELKLKVLRIAFGYLELGPGAIEFRDGHVFHKDSRTEGPLLDLGQVWKLASPSSKHYQGEMGLEVTSYFRSKGTTYAYGTHAAHVAVDPETGKLEILKYVVVEDIGHPINPRLVHGQVVGGAAQGIGATILEELVYGEDGQPLATTYMDCQGIILRC